MSAWRTASSSGRFSRRCTLFDEVDEHFGIRFAGEGVAVFEQGAFEHRVVFDNAVVDQRQAAVAAAVRVRVDIVGFAVGGPTGVTHTHVAAGIFFTGEIDQIGDLAFFLENVQVAVLQGDACAVVAAVFKPLKASDQDRVCFLGADVGNDSAHCCRDKDLVREVDEERLMRVDKVDMGL